MSFVPHPTGGSPSGRHLPRNRAITRNRELSLPARQGIRWAQGRWRTRHLELVGMGQSMHGHGGVGSLSPEAPSARPLSYRAITLSFLVAPGLAWSTRVALPWWPEGGNESAASQCTPYLHQGVRGFLLSPLDSMCQCPFH